MDGATSLGAVLVVLLAVACGGGDEGSSPGAASDPPRLIPPSEEWDHELLNAHQSFREYTMVARPVGEERWTHRIDVSAWGQRSEEDIVQWCEDAAAQEGVSCTEHTVDGRTVRVTEADTDDDFAMLPMATWLVDDDSLVTVALQEPRLISELLDLVESLGEADDETWAATLRGPFGQQSPLDVLLPPDTDDVRVQQYVPGSLLEAEFPSCGATLISKVATSETPVQDLTTASDVGHGEPAEVRGFEGVIVTHDDPDSRWPVSLHWHESGAERSLSAEVDPGGGDVGAVHELPSELLGCATRLTLVDDDAFIDFLVVGGARHEPLGD